MTTAERSLFLDWSDPICKQGDERQEIIRQIEALAIEHGCWSNSSSTEFNLESLLACEDCNRSQVVSLFRMYFELGGRCEAMMELVSGIQDLIGGPFKIRKT